MTTARDSLVRYRYSLSSGCSASGEPISHSNIPLVCRSKILVEMDWLGLSFTEANLSIIGWDLFSNICYFTPLCGGMVSLLGRLDRPWCRCQLPINELWQRAYLQQRAMRTPIFAGFNLNRPCRAPSVQVLNARSLGPHLLVKHQVLVRFHFQLWSSW